MKRLFLITMTIALLLTSAVFAEKADKKDGKPKKSVIVSMKLKSVTRDNKVLMAPKVLTRDKHEAVITIGNPDVFLNGKKVDEIPSKDGKTDWNMRISILPEIVEKKNIAYIKLKVEAKFGRKGSIIERKFSYATVDGEKAAFSIEKPETGEELSLEITTQINK